MMDDIVELMDEDAATAEALSIFEREVGTTGVNTEVRTAGHEKFLKFFVGRDSPFYKHALRETQKALSPQNPFRGALGLSTRKVERFPESLEATALLTLLTRSMRAVAQDTSERGFSVPYIPFQNQEDYQLAQPATHVIVGRRGVGKSTLIRRAVEILRATATIVAVIDLQAYAMLSPEDLPREILHDIVTALAQDAARVSKLTAKPIDTGPLTNVANGLLAGGILTNKAAVDIRRSLQDITKLTGNHAFVFLDDFHLVDSSEQPKILHLIHGCLKGANGWLKVSGIRSLLNYYSAADRVGLQVPGDAQLISLDLTLENPEAAERHLGAILDGFLNAIGYSTLTDVLPEQTFRRLAWANAGVPRDFLQMFVRAVGHARRNRHAVLTLSDVNVAIGEFGQTKMDELAQDARNSEGALDCQRLRHIVWTRTERMDFFSKVRSSKKGNWCIYLSDLRLVHLISQSITPDRAGERYEAFILDYSLFTGFRRRPNIRETLPKERLFKASELRNLPKVSEGFLSKYQTPGIGRKVRRNDRAATRPGTLIRREWRPTG